MINLLVSNYSKPFTHLNGNKTQNITPFDLARAIVTVGRSSWLDTANLGIYRIGELICKALAFAKMDQGNLVLHDRFYRLNQSEKATISYYFGQGLTKLYAEEYFKIKWLFHVDDYSAQIQFHKKGSATSKLTIGKTNKVAESPDLIGVQGRNTSHIFEAKGRSSAYDVNEMQHAINQVSQISTYNGLAPITRTACYYELAETPIRGTIIDPENDGEGIQLELDEEEAIATYYSFFLENKGVFANEMLYNGNKFLVVPIAVPNIYFGFDKRLLEIRPSSLLENGLYDLDLSPGSKQNDIYARVSLGYDGIILIDTRK